MKVLIDTNVILDVLCGRQQFLEASKKIFDLCEIEKITGYVSALSVANIVYIMRKELDPEKIHEILKMLMLIFNVSDLKTNDLEKAADMYFQDYEDALQCACAARVQADYIVTRNVRDFSRSTIPVIEPIELIELLRS